MAECRRTVGYAKIQDIDAFARRVELLREQTGQPIEGVFFAKTGFQRGAVKAAHDAGIDAVVCAQDQPLEAFGLMFNRYDPLRDRRYGEGEARLTATAKIVPGACAKVTTADGSVEDPGRPA